MEDYFTATCSESMAFWGSLSHVEMYLQYRYLSMIKKRKQNQKKLYLNPAPLNKSYVMRTGHMVMPMLMPKEIRQIQIHLRGERRDRDTPTDRKECASDKCTLPSAKPFPWWRMP